MINLSYYRKPTGSNGISFPTQECWNPITKVATIAADVNTERVSCRISIETLQNRFNASPDEPLEALKENRLALESAARKLIEKEAFEEDGSILIHENDI